MCDIKVDLYLILVEKKEKHMRSCSAAYAVQLSVQPQKNFPLPKQSKLCSK